MVLFSLCFASITGSGEFVVAAGQLIRYSLVRFPRDIKTVLTRFGLTLKCAFRALLDLYTPTVLLGVVALYVFMYASFYTRVPFSCNIGIHS